ncbi:MAG: capsular biosynthesis protein [Sarcina sp.]
MSIKTNVTRVFSANFLTMISGVLIGFIVPMVLTLDSYAYVKTYTLYVGYIGFLHLGFIDGMYMKYGGKDISEVDRSILKGEHNIFMLLQCIFTVFFVMIAMISKDIIIFLLAISIIPINTGTFHKLFYQSVGEFKRYAKISYIYTMIYLALNLIFVFFLKSDEFIIYCLASLMGHVALLCILEYKFLKEFKNIKASYIKFEMLKNIKVGFIVLIANLGIVIFNATDLWFAKFMLSTDDFAYYSFAISMLNVIGLLISSVSMTFYNYLAKGEDAKQIKKIKKYFLAIGAFMSLGYFFFAMIVTTFIKKYIPSLDIISISFAAFPYMLIINGLVINLYRARKNEKKYLKIMIIMVIISIIYNSIGIMICRNIESIAIATLLAFITWFIYSCYTLKCLNLNYKEIFYLSFITCSFLVASNKFNWLLGGIIYGAIFIILTVILFKDEIKTYIKQILIRSKIN